MGLHTFPSAPFVPLPLPRDLQDKAKPKRITTARTTTLSSKPNTNTNTNTATATATGAMQEPLVRVTPEAVVRIVVLLFLAAVAMKYRVALNTVDIKVWVEVEVEGGVEGREEGQDKAKAGRDWLWCCTEGKAIIKPTKHYFLPAPSSAPPPLLLAPHAPHTPASRWMRRPIPPTTLRTRRCAG